MSNRITNSDVQHRMDAINRHFEQANKNTQWAMSGRYGYQAIDAGPADGYVGQSTVITGCTKSEIYHALGVALEALRVLEYAAMPDKAERDKTEKEYREYYESNRQKWHAEDQAEKVQK